MDELNTDSSTVFFTCVLFDARLARLMFLISTLAAALPKPVATTA
jgi:hypothetical protein